MIILKVTMFLILLFCMQNISSMVADMKKIKPQLCAFRKESKKRYEIEAHNQKLKLTLPDFLSNWAFYKPIIMLEVIWLNSFLAMHLLLLYVCFHLPFFFLFFCFFSGLICKLPVGCFYRMDKNLNSTGRQTVKPTIRNNYNASMMSLFVVVVS